MFVGSIFLLSRTCSSRRASVYLSYIFSRINSSGIAALTTSAKRISFFSFSDVMVTVEVGGACACSVASDWLDRGGVEDGVTKSSET